MQLNMFDLFESPFSFKYAGSAQAKRKSMKGLFVSLLLYGIAAVFLVYLLMLYLENKLTPSFQSQIFYPSSKNTLNLNNHLFAIRLLAHPNSPHSVLQSDQQKSYLTFIPSIQFRRPANSQLVLLEAVQCSDNQLNDYQCFDFQDSYQLVNDEADQIDVTFQIRVYKCFDIDDLKLDIPKNCVSQQELDGLYNGGNSPLIQMKLLTQQYNTTTQGMQYNYKNLIYKLESNSYLQSETSTLQQIISIKKGLLLQEETQFQGPFDYTLDRLVYSQISSVSGPDKSIGLLEVRLDGKVQYTTVKYTTFYEVLSLWNSLIVLIVGIVVVGRFFTKRLMLEDISLVFMRNIYQNSYLNQLDLNKIFRKRQLRYQKRQLTEDLTEKKENINVPSITTKNNKKQLDPSSCQSKYLYDSAIEICDSRRQSDHNQMNHNTEGQKKTELNDLNIHTYIGTPSKEPLTYILQDQILQLSESSYLPNLNNIPHSLGNTFQLTNQQNIPQQKPQPREYSLLTGIKRDAKSAKPNPLSPFKLTNSIKMKENNNLSALMNNIPSNKTLQLQQSMGFKTQNKLEYKGDQYQENNTNTNQQQQGISQYCVLKLDNTESCTENLFALQNNDFSTQLKSVIFKMWKSKDKIKPEAIKEKEVATKILQEQVQKNMNILQIYKDLIVLKKAIMMLLSKEQYAALLLTGCSINQKEMTFQSTTEYNVKNTHECYTQRTVPQDQPFFSIKGKSIQQIMMESQKMNETFKQPIFGHLDEQFQIYDSEKWQLEYLKQFLQRCRDSSNLSELDKRILSSLTL